MTTILLIIHLFVTLALIGVVLIQRSEGGGLGVGTSQGMGGFMSGRGTANLLTRTTAVLGTIFFLLSLALALLNRGTGGVGRSLLDNPPPVSAAPAVPTSLVPLGNGATAPAAAPSGTATAPEPPAGSAAPLASVPLAPPLPAPVAPPVAAPAAAPAPVAAPPGAESQGAAPAPAAPKPAAVPAN